MYNRPAGSGFGGVKLRVTIGAKSIPRKNLLRRCVTGWSKFRVQIPLCMFRVCRYCISGRRPGCGCCEDMASRSMALMAESAEVREVASGSEAMWLRMSVVVGMERVVRICVNM